jgi:hypothetical protein
MEFNLNSPYYIAKLKYFENVRHRQIFYKLLIFLHPLLIYKQHNVTKKAG